MLERRKKKRVYVDTLWFGGEFFVAARTMSLGFDRIEINLFPFIFTFFLLSTIYEIHEVEDFRGREVWQHQAVSPNFK